MFWPGVDFINFYFLSSRNRVLFVNFMSLIYEAMVCYTGHKLDIISIDKHRIFENELNESDESTDNKSNDIPKEIKELFENEVQTNDNNKKDEDQDTPKKERKKNRWSIFK